MLSLIHQVVEQRRSRHRRIGRVGREMAAARVEMFELYHCVVVSRHWYQQLLNQSVGPSQQQSSTQQLINFTSHSQPTNSHPLLSPSLQSAASGVGCSFEE